MSVSRKIVRRHLVELSEFGLLRVYILHHAGQSRNGQRCSNELMWWTLFLRVKVGGKKEAGQEGTGSGAA